MKVKFKKLHPGAMAPEYATDGSGCFDFFAPHAVVYAPFPGMPVTVRTGLAVEIPEGHVMLIFSRSGHGFKHDVRLANCVGVIDSDYRGEIQVKLTADEPTGAPVLTFEKGGRIAQGLIVPFPRIEFVEVDELTDTERGANGFGSTGA